jgi:protein-S-isoprenylcysteine O-methyltransferase Ste14
LPRQAAEAKTSGFKGQIMRLLETKIPAPFVAIALAVGMWLLPRTAPAPGLIESLRMVATDVSSQLSAVIALAAFGAFWRARTTINPLKPERASVLVTHGIYRFTRNPMYLSLLLLLLSYASYLWSWEALAGPIAFVAYVTRFQIVPEERVLESKFGGEFADYKRRVRRWI